METRHIVYLVIFNFFMLLTVLVNQMENPYASVQSDLAYIGLCVGIQAWLFACVKVPELVMAWRKRK